MRKTAGLAFACGLAVAASPARAQGQDRSSRQEADERGGVVGAAPAGAAQRAVWDFVHFTTGAEIVDVIDSFDGDDPFDINLSVGFQRTLRRSKIVRECREPDRCDRAGARDDGAFSEFIDTVDIGRYTQETYILDLLLAVGLFRDLQFYTRWPLILSDTRSLGYLEDSPSDAYRAAIDQMIDNLFTIPFESPERSGLDYFAVGISWAPFNQQRDPTDPNWVLNFEGRFAVGDVLKAAKSGGEGGISRRLNEIRFGMFLSKRYRWIEPYSGITFMAGIPDYSAPYHFDAPVSGQINTMPPLQGSFLFGMEIVPWENLERLQKFSIGLEIAGTYHSEGRVFSELFDALGTSEDPRLHYERAPRPDGRFGPCTSDPGSVCWSERYGGDPLYRFSGMTDVENYASVMGRLTLLIQAAKYIKFYAGLGFGHDTEHSVTFTDECNAGEMNGPQDCQIGGDAYNPMTREVIDAPGNRFRVQETTIFDVFAGLTAMF